MKVEEAVRSIRGSSMTPAQEEEFNFDAHIAIDQEMEDFLNGFGGAEAVKSVHVENTVAVHLDLSMVKNATGLTTRQEVIRRMRDAKPRFIDRITHVEQTDALVVRYA